MEEIELSECVFCEKSLGEGATNKLTLRGCASINAASEQRGDIIKVKDGQVVHVSCRKRYMSERCMRAQKRPHELEEVQDSLMLRSESYSFHYETDCLFCCKTIPQYMFQSWAQKHVRAYKVRTKTFQEEIKAKCLEKKSNWGKKCCHAWSFPQIWLLLIVC